MRVMVHWNWKYVKIMFSTSYVRLHMVIMVYMGEIFHEHKVHKSYSLHNYQLRTI